MKNIFRSISIPLAIIAVGQIHAATITHTVVSSLSTTQGDSLEELLHGGDTLWIRANDGLLSLGAGLNFNTSDITLILDADANRDGTGTLASGFTLKATGANTQVRVLMGKNSKAGGTVTTPYHNESFPLIEIGSAPPSYVPYKFDLPNDAWLEVLYLVNSRNDMDQLGAVLAGGNAPCMRVEWLASTYRRGYALGKDIDMGAAPYTAMSSAPFPFQAVLDGMHNTLQNLVIVSSQDSVGLFRSTKFATIRNLELKATSIQGKDLVGGIAGVIDSFTTIQNVILQSGSISGSSEVAGIAGISKNSSVISYCRNHATINATTDASGIVAKNSGILDHLENRGTVTSLYGYAAGIVNTSTSATEISYLTNFGVVSGFQSAGILNDNTSSLSPNTVFAYNYGTVDGSFIAGGIANGGTAKSVVNYATVTSTAGFAGGIFGGLASSVRADAIVNLGKVNGFTDAASVMGTELTLRHFLNTGDIYSPGGWAIGACKLAVDVKYGLVSAAIVGNSLAGSEAFCTSSGSGIQNYYSVFNIDFAPIATVTNTLNGATPLDFSTLYNFTNYPEADSFKAFWHAPTSFTLPTPMNVFPDGQVYKKLRQDALVKDDTAALVLDSIHTYLPTYGNDWTYSCKARNGLATCTKGSSNLTITQAYNVTGAETIVFEAAHASGLVVRDSLQVLYNVERKSTPGLSATWPADIVVTEGTPVVLDLGQYFTDADGESITYTLSETKVVYSELNGDVLTLCYNKKVGTETFTVYATDAGGRVSPVASLAVTVSTLPGVLKALPVLVLKTDSVLTLDLDDYFWDADGDVLGYTVTEPKNNDAVLKGSILQIAMISLRPDSLVVTVADDDKHVLRAGLKLVNSASTVLAVHPEQRLGLELAGNLLRLTSAESATAWLRILDLQGGLRYETTLDLATGTNTLTLPALPQGAYRIHVRQGGSLRTLGWEKR